MRGRNNKTPSCLWCFGCCRIQQQNSVHIYIILVPHTIRSPQSTEQKSAEESRKHGSIALNHPLTGNVALHHPLAHVPRLGDVLPDLRVLICCPVSAVGWCIVQYISGGGFLAARLKAEPQNGGVYIFPVSEVCLSDPWFSLSSHRHVCR